MIAKCIKLCGTLSDFLSSKLVHLIRMCVSIKNNQSKGNEHPSRCQLLGYLLLKACIFKHKHRGLVPGNPDNPINFLSTGQLIQVMCTEYFLQQVSVCVFF